MKRSFAFVLLTVVMFSLFSLRQQEPSSLVLPRSSWDHLLPPIKGIPREEAWRILERHQAELMRMADIEGMTLALNGISILTDDPSGLPTEVEGIPIEVHPPQRPATIAGRPYKEAEAILERHRERLSRLPDVDQVSLGLEGILIATDDPSVLPAEVEGLPIIAGPPVTHIPSSGGIPYKQAKAILDRHSDYLRGLPQVENVMLGMEGILVFTDNRGVLPKDVEGLPVVPRIPDRFPRIHGLPYEEAQAIFERNQEMLRHLPGVQDVGFNIEQGLVVMADNPAAVPKMVEGLPITIIRAAPQAPAHEVKINP